MNVVTPAALLALALAIVGTPSALGADQRDVVFECPCSAEWVPAGSGSSGELKVHFGVRNFRTSESGEMRLSFARDLHVSQSVATPLDWREFSPGLWLPVGSVGPDTTLTNQSRTFALSRLATDRPVLILLHERMAEPPTGALPSWSQRPWQRHEGLALWPVPRDTPADPVRFVDLLTDTDGDGVGDVNERLAGTSPGDTADTPGRSNIDVLALFDDRTYAAYGNDPYTRIHHLLTLARARFEDSGTNIRLRTVGIRHTEWNARGLSAKADTLMAEHGADLVVQFHAKLGTVWPCPSDTGGCAPIGSMANRGLWTPTWAAVATWTGADTVAHQLGHVLGLAHSARQGEADGAFRWSRGYYVRGPSGQARPQGTIMTHGPGQEFGDRFSNPRAQCDGRRCGVRADAPDGADAAASLDLLRFQAAASRAAMPDTDGDGFVDAADAWPDDPRVWSDLDGDGLTDTLDTDDDGDGVADGEDAFPFDPAEWADADGDRTGDNADAQVADLTAFRDAALLRAVEVALRKPSDEPVTASDLASLETLSAENRGIRNLTGLELATSLRSLDLRNNAISDLAPLAGLTTLEELRLDDNDIHDASPVAALTALETLGLSQNTLSDIASLATLTSLQSLALDHNDIGNLAPLASLAALTTLTLSENAVATLTPLTALTSIVHLDVSHNRIVDMAPLSGMRLDVLRAGYNPVEPRSLRTLQLREDAILDLTGLRLEHVYTLPTLVGLEELILRDNFIFDVRRLQELDGVKLLDLSANHVVDIAPLVQRDIWRYPHFTSEAHLRLGGNPLGSAALDEQVPTLRSWGLNVQLDESPDGRRAVTVPDPTLHALIAETLSGDEVLVDHAITTGTISKLKTLRAAGAGLEDLTGLEAARNLEYLYAASNALTDLTPLAELRRLEGLDLRGNGISDIGPLVENPYLGRRDWIALDNNPLSEESVNMHIPALLDRDIRVSFDGIRLVAAAHGDPVQFEIGGHFAAVLGDGFRVRTKVRDPALAHGEFANGTLTVRPGASAGRATVTVTGTSDRQRSASVTFSLTLQGARFASTFPPATDPIREGLVRVINRTLAPETLRIAAFDQSGTQRSPTMLEAAPGQAAQFNSEDLEAGNPAKGLSDGVGSGDGDWRLAFDGGPNTRVLSYIRATDGLVTSMHELAPMNDGGHRVVFFNPASNLNQVSLLRLVNPRSKPTAVTITGVDDAGASPGNPVRLSLGPQEARTLSAEDLETGAGLTGALEDGSGKWRLTVAADYPILVASLLQSRTGHLANLSSVPDNQVQRDAETVHRIPLFLSAAEAGQREGFARVINHGSEEATVLIRAWDDAGMQGDRVSLTVPAGSAGHFNSTDLEFGNAAKGLSGGIGHGQGHWRLELASEADLDVLSYIRTADGFVTSLHDTVPRTSGRYEVAIFNPGSNRAQVSVLRIVNPDTDQAWVSITGIDDAGDRGGNVTLAVAPGKSLTLTADALESGEGVTGALGDGTGKWRLTVTPRAPDQSLQVMNLLESPTRHLTNLSTGPE